MGYLTCKKCGLKPDNESDLDLHHIVPKGLGGTDKDGRIYLCGDKKGNDCHRKLHKKIKDFLTQATREWLDDENSKTTTER